MSNVYRSFSRYTPVEVQTVLKACKVIIPRLGSKTILGLMFIENQQFLSIEVQRALYLLKSEELCLFKSKLFLFGKVRLSVNWNGPSQPYSKIFRRL